MRIISKTKDYYDCVMSCAQDQSLLYVREEEEEVFSDIAPPLPRAYGLSGCEMLIGFCGRLYPLVEFDNEDYTKRIQCYNLAEVDAYMDTKPKWHQGFYYSHDKERNWRAARRHGVWMGPLRGNFKRMFDELEKRKDDYQQVFLDKRCPIFVLLHGSRNDTIRWNASLREFDFMRIKDPYTAFQEIAMFMGNLAEPRKPIPAISDELKAESKGFDQFSFRQPPKKKK